MQESPSVTSTRLARVSVGCWALGVMQVGSQTTKGLGSQVRESDPYLKILGKMRNHCRAGVWHRWLYRRTRGELSEAVQWYRRGVVSLVWAERGAGMERRSQIHRRGRKNRPGLEGPISSSGPWDPGQSQLHHLVF